MQACLSRVVVMFCSRCLGPISHAQPAFCPPCQQTADLLPLIAGLSATLASEVQAVVGGGDGRAQGPGPLQRAGVLALALGPPLAISLAHPGSFLAVLQARRAACLGGFPCLLCCHLPSIRCPMLRSACIAGLNSASVMPK